MLQNSFKILILIIMYTQFFAGLYARTNWTATATGIQGDAYEANYAIDGDHSTRWSSPHSDEQAFTLDLDQVEVLGGVILYWEAAYASGYKISTSLNKKDWETVYATENGNGKTDYIYFPTHQARYVRLTGVKRATAWGYSIWEIELITASNIPSITSASSKDADLPHILDGDFSTVAQPKVSAAVSTGIDLDLKQPLVISGAEIHWGKPFAQNTIVESSIDGTLWEFLAESKDGSGGVDFLVGKERAARYLRFKYSNPAPFGDSFSIKEIVLRGPGEELTPLLSYRIKAQSSEPGWYPDSLNKKQVYWTTLGMPRGQDESLLDEYGNLEVRTHAPQIMPYIKDSEDGLISSHQANSVHQSLAQNYLPIPRVRWELDKYSFEIEAFSKQLHGKEITFAKYTLKNSSSETQSGSIYLTVRPVQINPPWQYGGLATVGSLDVSPSSQTKGANIWVNDKLLAYSVTPISASATSSIANGDIIEFIGSTKAELPNSQKTVDPEELASGVLVYEFSLAPNASKEIILMCPIYEDNSIAVPTDVLHTDSFARDAWYQYHANTVAQLWQSRLNQTVIDFPDPTVVNTLKSQIAYILINQDGDGIQPGSRNYNRSFIRDGVISAAALIKMNLLKEANDYIDWYGQHAVHPNGLVSPILNNDGSVNQGFGSDLEYDSQGEWIYLIRYFYDITQDAQFLAKHYSSVKKAMGFLAELRQRTLVEGYMGEEMNPARFRGILPPSISHEGYSTPHHSYWDNYWALKGWHDGAQLALIMGDHETVQWARSEYQALRAALQASIETMIEWKQLKHIPCSAELGDPDVTSVSIAFAPCQQDDIFPQQLLQEDFLNYFNNVLRRETSEQAYGYTPYEMRNVMALVRLNKPREAYRLLQSLLRDSRPQSWNQFAEVVHSDPRLAAYIGDMPHTWVGADYVNTIFGMLFFAEGSTLNLLQGAPENWIQGSGIELKQVPTIFGNLDMEANGGSQSLTVTLGGNIHRETDIVVWWPSRVQPKSVIIDGVEQTHYDDNCIQIKMPFKTLVAIWDVPTSDANQL